MSEDITVTYRLSDVAEVRWTGLLTQRFFGRWAAAAVVATAAVSVIAMLVLIDVGGLFSADLADVWLGVIVGGLAIILSGLVNRAYAKRMLRATLAAPFRHEEIEYRLCAEGIVRSNGTLPWRWIVDVAEVPGATLLLLAPREYLPVPHDLLPEGVTPEVLRARIAAWRAGATGAA